MNPIQRGKKQATMNLTVSILMLLAGILTLLAYLKDTHLPIEGLKDGWGLFWNTFSALVFPIIIVMLTRLLWVRFQ